MYPGYYCNQIMTDALLLDHQQMVQREIERNRWAQPSIAARVARRAVAMIRACAAWSGRATGERSWHWTTGTAIIPSQHGAHADPEERCSA